MRVYVGEQLSGTFRLWRVDSRPAPTATEISAVMRELATHLETSAIDGLRQGPLDEVARRAALAHKNDVLARIRAAEESAPPHLLLELPGDGAGHGIAIAGAILADDLGLTATPAIAAACNRDLIAGHAADDIRVLDSRLHQWIVDNRDLVERELFLDPPALSVSPTDEPPRDSNTNPATASALVAACETAWSDIQRHHAELPDAVVILGTGVERGRLVKLGHWWGGRWVADGQVRGEVLIAGEALHLEPQRVFEILLHEAAHGLNAARGVKDTSRGGRYHNQRYATTAREVLLRVRPMPPYGMADTRLSDAAIDRYGDTIAQLADTMRIARQLERVVRMGADSGQEAGDGGTSGIDDRGRGGGANVVAACGCGRRMRMAPTVLAAGPVVCGMCGKDFAATAERSNNRHRERANGVVDNSFVERRREALAAESPSAASESQAETLARQRDRLAAAIQEGASGGLHLAPLVERHERLTTITGSGSPETATSTQRDGIHELQRLAPSEQELSTATTWYERFGTRGEEPMLARTAIEEARRTRLARSLLKADGTLQGPSVTFGQLELMAGDRVVSARDAEGGPPSGTLGTVVHVDSELPAAEVDFATWGRLRATMGNGIAAALRHDYTTKQVVRAALEPRIELERLVPEVEL